MKKSAIIFFTLLLAAAAARAGVTGAQFLRIDADARLSGMASAGIAAMRGINSLSYNPAGLAAITGPEAAFSHSQWLMDTTHDFAGFGFSVKRSGQAGERNRLGIGLGITRLSNGSMDGRGEDRGVGGGFTAYDQAISLGFGYKNFGGAVKYIQSSIAGVRAEAFAVDLGAQRALTRLPVTLGFGVQNLGGGIKYLTQRDKLPLSVNAGVSVAAFPGVSLAFDAKRLVYDKQTVFSAGTEYALLTAGNMGLALRGGYGLAGLARDGGKGGLSVGAGIMALGAQLDYALSPETALGSIQRITLKKKF